MRDEAVDADLKSRAVEVVGCCDLGTAAVVGALRRVIRLACYCVAVCCKKRGVLDST